MPNIRATKTLQKRSDSAQEAFHKFYAAIWGEERWQNTLFSALSAPTRYCALLNQYADPAKAHEFICKSASGENTISEHPLSQTRDGSAETHMETIVALIKSSTDPFPPPAWFTPSLSASELLSHWNMDAASILAACMLQVRPGDRVLDLCAAPGGKSIVLAQMLWPDLGTGKSLVDGLSTTVTPSILHSNESDKSRHNRLESNLKSYIPKKWFADDCVKVLHIDGSDKSAVDALPLGEGGYDKVLVDAPCSSERHIIHAHLKANSGRQISEEMANWKAGHSKTLAKTQLALLMTALKAVKIGGSVIYATCSISYEENDSVVERLLDAVKRERKRTRDRSLEWKVKIDNSFETQPNMKAIIEDMTESTKYGRIALPDHPAGGRWGPLYSCMLTKVIPKDKASLSKLDSET